MEKQFLSQLTENETWLLKGYVERFTEKTIETITETELYELLNLSIAYTLDELQQMQVSSGLWESATEYIEKISVLHSISKKAGFMYEKYSL